VPSRRSIWVLGIASLRTGSFSIQRSQLTAESQPQTSKLFAYVCASLDFLVPCIPTTHTRSYPSSTASLKLHPSRKLDRASPPVASTTVRPQLQSLPILPSFARALPSFILFIQKTSSTVTPAPSTRLLVVLPGTFLPAILGRQRQRTSFNAGQPPIIAISLTDSLSTPRWIFRSSSGTLD